MKTVNRQFYKQNTFYVVMERHIPAKKALAYVNWTPWNPLYDFKHDPSFEFARSYASEAVECILDERGWKEAEIAILSVYASGNHCVWIKTAKQPKK